MRVFPTILAVTLALVASSSATARKGSRTALLASLASAIVQRESAASVFGVRVYGKGYSGNAGSFEGDVHVTGVINKTATAFKIDHPKDPTNKYLYHSAVESPDMKNVYDGVVVLDSQGKAVVKLPDWFQALNRDFRYQLTAIGKPTPNLHIAKEVVRNQFEIAGGEPKMRISWQVTGIRQDAWANAHRIPVEQKRPPKNVAGTCTPNFFASQSQRESNWGAPRMRRP